MQSTSSYLDQSSISGKKNLLPSYPAPDAEGTNNFPQAYQNSYLAQARINGIISDGKENRTPATDFGVIDYEEMLRAQEMRFTNMQLENERLKHFLPESYTEMRLKMKQYDERIAAYERKIFTQENEKKELHAKIRAKDEDLQFMKKKYDDLNNLWQKEIDEKKKLEGIVE